LKKGRKGEGAGVEMEVEKGEEKQNKTSGQPFFGLLTATELTFIKTNPMQFL
jgi:hypothetical protein